MNTEFTSVFQLSKKAMFEVRYYSLAGNQHPYFATSAETFNQPKTDFNCCGQCQKEVLKSFPTAMRFFEKWDTMHLKDLTEEEYAEMRSDLKALEEKYNHILRERKEGDEAYTLNISVHKIKELSKMTPKKGGKTA